MDMLELYDRSSFRCSRKVTELYSSSFSLGIRALDKKYHDAIYGIYGFVRFADEIVDTMHDYNKQELLERFRTDTYKALQEGISLNPILHAFQKTVKKYAIDRGLIDAFLHSMEMDLHQTHYREDNYTEYIYGSAEVVGLMCLKVFCDGDEKKYSTLKLPARYLGAAFQKVNFLRDLQDDYIGKGRVYFPNVDFTAFCFEQKQKIEEEIQEDFRKAYTGIIALPKSSRFGVYLAYRYYLRLFKKIESTHPEKVLQVRIRISNTHKLAMWAGTYFRSGLLGVYAP